MSDEFITLLAEEITKQLRDDAARFNLIDQLRPGTVATTTTDSKTVMVLVDNDVDAIEVMNVLGTALKAGQRVMVLFVKPHGAYVVGPVGSTPVTKLPPLTWALSGPLYVTESPPWRGPRSGNLKFYAVRISVLTAATTGSPTVDVRKDGAVVHTISLTTGQTTKLDVLTTPLAAENGSSYWTTKVTAAGGGAKDLTTQLDFNEV